MPMDDLYQALNMFKAGVKDLNVARVISGANEQVQAIRASEADEAAKRQALTQLSQQLVGQMGAIGAPAADIAQQAGNIMPKSYANANAMNEDALMTGNAELGTLAQKQQDFENNKAFTLAKMKAEAKSDPLRAMQFQALQDERFRNHLSTLDKAIDTQTTRFGNIARLQDTNNTIKDARSLLEGDIYNLNVAEVAKTMDRILTRAAPTISGTQEVAPHTLKQWMAKNKEYLTSSPQKVNIPEFVDFYRKTLDRIEKINGGIIKDAQRQKIASATSLARMNPEQFKTWASSRGFDVSVDEKTGKLNVKDVEQAAPTGQSQTAAPEVVMVRDKRSGQMIKAQRGPDGKLYPVK